MNLEEKLKKYFADMLVYKSPEQSKFFATLSLPCFLRDWLVKKFSNENGEINLEEVSNYIKKYIPRKEQWEQIKYAMSQKGEEVKFLAKVRVEVDITDRETIFYLPDFGYPKKKKETVIDKEVLIKNEKNLLTDNEVWGIVDLACYDDNFGKTRVHMVDFKPFCPYDVDLEYFQEARKYFTIAEWLDVLLLSIDYNPTGFIDKIQKTTLLSRLLPFVEKRVNLIEFSPKGTGKSYMYSQLSKYGWLVSGGSITRAKLFYDLQKNTEGLIKNHDYVVLDEIQSIIFPNPEEIQGALKGYLESGEYRIGNHRGIGEAGVILLGNIKEDLMNAELDMFQDLPEIFHESALLDRMHGFIKGWDIPRMKENMKANGWALNVEYFSEILHLLRDDLRYRAIVDEILEVPKSADTRDTEAIKRLCTGLLKIFFPCVKNANDIDLNEFQEYCLSPALQMRSIIKKQMGIFDKEFRGKEIPEIRCKLLTESRPYE